MQIDLGPNPSTSETAVLATRVEARYARIKITNDTKNLVKAEPALNFEFYGCVITADVSGNLTFSVIYLCCKDPGPTAFISYFDECQKTEIHLFYLHFIFTLVCSLTCEIVM